MKGVDAHRDLHPKHGRLTIAEALLPKYGREKDQLNSGNEAGGKGFSLIAAKARRATAQPT